MLIFVCLINEVIFINNNILFYQINSFTLFIDFVNMYIDIIVFENINFYLNLLLIKECLFYNQPYFSLILLLSSLSKYHD